jgi:hypothetical protein
MAEVFNAEWGGWRQFDFGEKADGAEKTWDHKGFWQFQRGRKVVRN